MNTIFRSFNRFATLNAQYLVNKSRNAVRFQSQNIIWDYQEANYQSQAFAKGLTSLAFQKNDNFLLRLPTGHQAESYIVKVGTAAINANLIISQAKTREEADNQIKSNNIKAIVFEPSLAFGRHQTYLDVLNSLIPELSSTQNGAQVKSAKYPSLKALIQTNFYTFPGIFKFRVVILLFRAFLTTQDDKYFKIPSVSDFQPIALPPSNNTIFVTEAAHDFAFRAGILNSNINGRFLVVTQTRHVNKLVKYYDGKVDLIATEEVNDLDPSVNVYVQKGSQLFKEHPKRTQL